jgi:hypothetical protein
MYTFMKARQLYSCTFHIFNLNNVKVIYDLYSQCLTEILSKTTLFIGTEGVLVHTTTSHEIADEDCPVS